MCWAAADAYSFGVLVWEALSRSQPWRELNQFQIINVVGMESKRLPLREGTPLLWLRVMDSCWDRNPRRRPTFEQLDRVLRAATAQLSEGAAKLLPPSRIPPDLLGEAEAEAEASDGPEPDAAVDAAAEAGAGMEAWREVAVEILERPNRSPSLLANLSALDQ